MDRSAREKSIRPAAAADYPQVTAGPDYILEIDGVADPRAGGDAAPAGRPPRHAGRAPAAAGGAVRPRSEADAQPGTSLTGRPWIAVYWKCCHRYSRLYRDASGQHYQGRCPRCQRLATARVGPDGTPQRFFEAS